MSGKFLLGNMLSAVLNKSSFFDVPVIVEYSKLCNNVLNVLLNNGYIESFEVIESNNIKKISIIPSIDVNNKKIMNKFSLHSTPGSRYYIDAKDLKKVIIRNPYKLFIVSNSNGVMNAHDSIKLGLGGELLCEVF